MKTPAKSLVVRTLERLNAMSYSKLFSLWMLMALGFGAGYFILSSVGDVSHHGPEGIVDVENPFYRFLNGLYFSIITATSTGYGDIVPRGLSKALASIQSITALFIFAAFVTKLVSYRQEQALREVHRLSFEDVFHNLREGLYIVRNDYDELIAKAKNGEQFTEEDWITLVIAHKQAQSLISEIPDFYNEENELYVIDKRREQLMHEAIHRTLHRVNEMLDVLSKHDVDWPKHPQSIKELRELMAVVHRVTPLWREKSPYQSEEAFEDILHLKASVSSRIEGSLPV